MFTLQVMKDHGCCTKDTPDELSALIQYANNLVVDIPIANDACKSHKVVRLNYDIMRWRGDSYSQKLSRYYHKNIEYAFSLTEVRRHSLCECIAHVGDAPAEEIFKHVVTSMKRECLNYEVSKVC